MTGDRSNLTLLWLLLLGLSTSAASSEPPLKGYRGWLTPTEYYGIFLLLEEPEEKNEIVSFLFNENPKFFRLRGIDISAEVLRDHLGGTYVYCEEYGSVSASSVGLVSIVDCRSEEILSLSRLLLDNGVAKPICSEIGLRSELCKK